jgi:hypothetical protein
MNARDRMLLTLDAVTLANLLAVLSDAAAHRGDSDLRGVLQLAQRQAERVAEQVEAFANHKGDPCER